MEKNNLTAPAPSTFAAFVADSENQQSFLNDPVHDTVFQEYTQPQKETAEAKPEC